MRKHFLFLFLASIAINSLYSQARGNRVGFIDMEYILQNVNSYNETNALLEEKADKWKQEIESKKLEINKVKDALTAEKPLLTKSLIEERETEITFLENELLDLQQKRFGPNGLLMSQKALLVKPIQDQVFTAVQDIAEAKKYDFIFDKSSDLTLLFADKRFDISDQVLRIINRTEKREQLTKKELAAEQEKEEKEDAIADNPNLAERQKILDERKAARDKILADRKLAQEQKKKEYEERRQKILDDRAAKKNGTVSETTKTNSTNAAATNGQKAVTEEAPTEAELARQQAIEAKEKAAEDRKKLIEDRRKALEERRLQIIRQRDSIKAAREEKLKQ
ncbi:periplasmic chaperone for outer membrane proteins Skp [Flavobacterium flevense]|uniref:Membrane protein n=1 Tax=Flavobacterium flevense TaxID=983 RepID=A0A4Y4AXV2_9FLAO|nr:OmpH family outer membrane protein [Flavobacterium flevense]GEC72956.1 membrane protein [Flavobacterium flevense]SHL36132.1 periplasmic chaperone for outer membrane proteins Skp [Flavobacterium flevense]